MSGDLKPSEVLARAADIIEPEGMWSTDHMWADGTSGDDREGFCILDAVIKAHPQGKIINGWMMVRQALPLQGAATMPQYVQARAYGRSLDASWCTMKAPHCGALGSALIKAIGPDCKGFPTGLVEWNDTAGRTQAEVVAALRKAADLARSEGQ